MSFHRDLHLRNRIIVRGPSFPLLALPTELRYDVYKTLAAPLLSFPTPRRLGSISAQLLAQVGHHSTRHVSADTAEAQRACFSLLLLCHQIRDEAFPFVFARIVLPVRDPLNFANNFLRLLEPDKLCQLKHFKFTGTSRYLIGAAMPDRLELKQLVEIFRTYPELANLHTFTMEYTLYAFRMASQSLLFTVTKVVTSSTLRHELYHDHNWCLCPSIHCSKFAQYGDANVFALECATSDLAKIRFKGFVLTKKVRDVGGSSFFGNTLDRVFTFTFENPSRPGAKAAVQALENQPGHPIFG